MKIGTGDSDARLMRDDIHSREEGNRRKQGPAPERVIIELLASKQKRWRASVFQNLAEIG
jgi:hypothetical protein